MPSPTLILPALLLGLAGSLHCVGMCGPLLLAIPLRAKEKWDITKQMLVYHSGRILTYAALGILFGLLGKGLALAGLQKVLSITAGVFMLGMALMAWKFEQMVTALPGFGLFTQKVKTGIGGLLRNNPNSSTFSIGLLNGLLPCGMVYAALAGALASFGGVEGGVFMAFFGLGTLPLLLMVNIFSQSFGINVRKKIRMAQPVLLGIVGILLLQRGLNLDLSLFESSVPKAGMDCH
ncbi:MAG: sulfite exporter TauE/SafE family protein [Saprospiraceae bacterium]|nr:sulfite exporter TauE/SafE family protein [Saprospiraceae bacterium]